MSPMKRMTTEQSIEEAKFWSAFGWAKVKEPENRNPDIIPKEFRIDFGCPVCGSAWGELDALGFQAPKVHTGHISWLESPVIYPDVPLPETFIRCVRLICLEEHTIDYDRVKQRHRVYTDPFGLSLGLMAIVGSVFLWSAFNDRLQRNRT